MSEVKKCPRCGGDMEQGRDLSTPSLHAIGSLRFRKADDEIGDKNSILLQKLWIHRNLQGNEGKEGQVEEMKVDCPVCGVEGHLQVRENTQRVLHYRRFVNGRRVYERHRMEINRWK